MRTAVGICPGSDAGLRPSGPAWRSVVPPVSPHCGNWTPLLDPARPAIARLAPNPTVEEVSHLLVRRAIVFPMPLLFAAASMSGRESIPECGEIGTHFPCLPRVQSEPFQFGGGMPLKILRHPPPRGITFVVESTTG